MRVLVTGATGNVGRLVVDELAGGDVQVRALTTNPARAALPPGVEVAVGYVGKPATCADAFVGVDRMYLAPVPETAADAVRMARTAGIRRIVDLSGEPESWWSSVAEAVEAGGPEWTHLWPGEFMENLTMWADQIRRTGQVRGAYPHAANAPIAMVDVARVAAAALLRDDLVGASLTMTGPETLTRAQLLDHLAAALDRDILFVEVSHDQAVEDLTPDMGEYAAWYVEGLASLAEEPQEATTTVADVVGSATTFAEWARANVDEFR